MKRILIAGIVGGIIVFIWGAVAHTLLPWKHMGIRWWPLNDVTVLPALQTTFPEPGLYMFPGLDESLPEQERMSAWEAKAKTGPRGLIIIDPRPDDHPGISPMKLAREGVSNVLAALIAAIILTRLAGNFVARALAVSAMGLFGWISLMVSYWNWDSFPGEFITAELITEVVGWFAAGLAMALIVARPQMYHAAPA